MPESIHTLLVNRRKCKQDFITGDPEADMPQYLELAMYHRDGHIILTETVISLIWGEDGRSSGMIGSIRNINARKQAEHA
jgi:PAS domain S-box-containing protein